MPAVGSVPGRADTCSSRVALDLRTEQGREALGRLLERADVPWRFARCAVERGIQGAVSGTAAVVSGLQPVSLREGLAGRTLRSRLARMRSWHAARCRAVLVRACPVVPLAAGCGDEPGKHAGVPHGRPCPEQR